MIILFLLSVSTLLYCYDHLHWTDTIRVPCCLMVSTGRKYWKSSRKVPGEQFMFKSKDFGCHLIFKKISPATLSALTREKPLVQVSITFRDHKLIGFIHLSACADSGQHCAPEESICRDGQHKCKPF